MTRKLVMSRAPSLAATLHHRHHHHHHPLTLVLQWKMLLLLWAYGALSVFQQKFTLDDAIGSHACPLEALACA
jgi:hypothetical protein